MWQYRQFPYGSMDTMTSIKHAMDDPIIWMTAWIEQKKLCESIEKHIESERQKTLMAENRAERAEKKLSEKEEQFKKELASQRGCDSLDVSHNTRSNKRIRGENEDPVQAVPWFCAICDSTGVTLQADQSKLVTPSTSKDKDKKYKTTDQVQQKRNARKIEAKLNAEKEDSSSEDGPTVASPNSFLCDDGTLRVEVQVAVKSKGGRPVGLMPTEYVGNTIEWRSLTREQRRGISKKLKRCRGAQ